MGRLGSVAEVLARMRDLDAALAADDGVRVFNRVYLRVTEAVAQRVADGDVFADDAFMAALDVQFAELWFAAYDATPDAVPRAWAPLFAARTSQQVLPIQFALAGMNAHIEHDLPLAVVRTCRERDRTPAAPGVHEDYERVNALLAEVEAEIRRGFLTEVGRRLDRQLAPVAHLVSSWDVDKARDVAWVNVLALWELRRTPLVFDGYAAALARTVGMGSRLLLTPLV